MFTLLFWRATVERAVRTFAQASVAALGAGAVGLVDMPWLDAASIGGGAAVLAVLTAVAAARSGPDGPGLTETATPAAQPPA
jgi:hypothetical protein